MKSKKIILILSALAAALCLNSCDKNEEVTNANDGPVRFTAGIGREAVATPQSRASGTTWHKDDAIGIFMLKHGPTTDIAESAENRKFTTTTGNGTFTPVIGQEIYYPMNNSYVDFIAYYPHRDGATLTTAIPVEIATAQTDASQPKFDLMWAKATNADPATPTVPGPGYTKNGATAPVKFTFGHCLAKLTMNCTVDLNVGASTLLADATVTIHGMNTKGNFDLKTGDPTGTLAEVKDITPRQLATPTDGFHGTYDAIILPGTYADNKLTVDFTLAGETYTWNVDGITFNPGHEYIYKVTITRTGVKAEGTIAPWQTIEKGGVTAE